MMAVSMGIKVQPSRFSVLKVESESDSGGEEGGKGQWTKVTKGGGRKGGGNQGSLGVKQGVVNGGGGGVGGGGMSKSAKKRARKKRNQSASSESADGGPVGAAVVSGGGTVVQERAREGVKEREEEIGWQVWQEKAESAADDDFEKELEEAILLSALEAEQQLELEKQRKAAEALAARAKAKKPVTVSLQELHRGGPEVLSPPPSKDVESPKLVSQAEGDTHFFERVGEEVQGAARKQRPRKASERNTSPPAADESARVAQLKDELEKRDRVVSSLQEENERLQGLMKEVKQRNQSLCKIMGQGEFSTKADLIQQIDELSTVKNELTEEVASLNSLLEQERSKNKSLRAEVAKLQGLVAKGSKH